MFVPAPSWKPKFFNFYVQKSSKPGVFHAFPKAFQIEDIQICYSCQPLPAQTWQLYVQNLAFSCLANGISNRRYSNIFEGSLEVKTSDNMDRWKAEQGRGREKRKIRREKIKKKKERARRKKMQMCEKVGKSRNTVFFQWFGAPLKRRVRSQLGRWEMTNCTPLWREAHFQVKMYKALGVRTTFGSWDVEKVHAVVARSTFPSQNVQNTSGADHFWHLRCRKSARRCGAKRISKSKCTKHHMFAPLLEVQMSFRVAGARDCAPCQKWPKREGSIITWWLPFQSPFEPWGNEHVHLMLK